MNGAQPVAISMWASIASWFTPAVLFCILNLMIGTIFIASSLKTHSRQHQEQQHGTEHDQSPSPLLPAPSLLERVRSINFSLYKFEHNPSEMHTQQPTHVHNQFAGAPSEHPDPYFTETQNFNPPEVHAQLVRAPSLLERVRSMKFKFPNNRSEEHPDPYTPEFQHSDPKEVQTKLTRKPSLLERVRSVKFSLTQSDQTVPLNPLAVDQHADSIYEQDPKVEADTHNLRPGESWDHDHHVTTSKFDSQKETPARNTTKKMMKRSTSEKAAAEEEDEKVDRRRPATVREPKGRWSRAALFEEDEEVDAKADDFINRFRQQLKLQRLDSLLKYKEKLNAKSV